MLGLREVRLQGSVDVAPRDGSAPVIKAPVVESFPSAPSNDFGIGGVLLGDERLALVMGGQLGSCALFCKAVEGFEVSGETVIGGHEALGESRESIMFLLQGCCPGWAMKEGYLTRQIWPGTVGGILESRFRARIADA